MLSDGISQTLVSTWTKEHDPYVSRLAIGRHQRAHLGIESQMGRRPVSEDYATAVRDRAHERMAAGEIQPGIRDGLNAQKMLDDRAMSANDREMMLILAQVLGGAYNPPALPDPDEIEGEIVEISEPASAPLPRELVEAHTHKP